MTSWLRQDSDKQTGMVDDFEDFFKGKSRCSYNTRETKPSPTFPVFPSRLAYVDWVQQRIQWFAFYFKTSCASLLVCVYLLFRFISPVIFDYVTFHSFVRSFVVSIVWFSFFCCQFSSCRCHYVLVVVVATQILQVSLFSRHFCLFYVYFVLFSCSVYLVIKTSNKK